MLISGTLAKYKYGMKTCIRTGQDAITCAITSQSTGDYHVRANNDMINTTRYLLPMGNSFLPDCIMVCVVTS